MAVVAAAASAVAKSNAGQNKKRGSKKARVFVCGLLFDKPPHDLGRAEIVEVDVPAFGKSHKAFWLVRRPE